ncbi:MAG: TRAP transporter large permease subunit [Pseudomonadota bacterium]
MNGKIWVEELLLSLPGGETGFLVVITIIVFIMGCFLDFFEIAFVIVPLLVGPAETLGIDLIWLGIILGINLQTSFLTPPFGFALFYLRSISPKNDWEDEVTGERIEGIKTGQIYKGVLPYIVIQFIAIMVVIFYPRLVTHYRDDVQEFDLDNVTIELPNLGGSNADGSPVNPGGLGLPGLNLNNQAPIGNEGLGLPAPGGLGLPGGLNLNNEPPPTDGTGDDNSSGGLPAPGDLSGPPPIQ